MLALLDMTETAAGLARRCELRCCGRRIGAEAFGRPAKVRPPQRRLIRAELSVSLPSGGAKLEWG